MLSDVTRDLLAFLTASPTPYHAVASAIERLEEAGFTRIDERDDWTQRASGRCYLTHGDSALLAFILPDSAPRGFRIVGAHTDSPNLRLKQKASYVKESYAQLGVEVYGGALLNSWLDRDLALAGRILTRPEGTDPRTPFTSHLVTLDSVHLRVPQLAIHLDRDVNEKGLVLNRQEHLAPVVGMVSSGAADRAPFDANKLAAESLGIDPATIAATEWMLYDTLAPAVGGANEEFIFSARLDNLAMSHAAITAVVQAADACESSGVVPVAALFDHEEVGSESAYGAASALLPRVLERITKRKGGSFETHAQILARSSCLSADMAHAVHPNYESRHEPRHKPQINGGPVLKRNAQQRYATSARTGALFTELCRDLGMPVQEYVNRTDLACGSTIGPITSTLLGIPTADIGNAMLSMHSIREMAGTEDPERMVRVLTAYFSTLREA